MSSFYDNEDQLIQDLTRIDTDTSQLIIRSEVQANVGLLLGKKHAETALRSTKVLTVKIEEALIAKRKDVAKAIESYAKVKLWRFIVIDILIGCLGYLDEPFQIACE